jgi:hypothetical protein
MRFEKEHNDMEINSIWDVMPCGLVKFADVSEDCIASIFKIEVMPGKQ